VPDQLVNPVLADLYVGYGTMLQQLTPMECWKLSSDPHTLLLGAPERLAEFQLKLSEDGRAQDEIQLIRSLFTPLCFDNVDDAVRNAMSLDATNTKAIKLLEVALAGKVGYKLHMYTNEIIPRMEKGEPVKGHLFAFEINRNVMAGENEL
jgi:hypothetical protein